MTDPVDVQTLQTLVACDPVSGSIWWKMSKGTRKAGSAAGFENTQGYIGVRINRRYYAGHRIVWALHYGAWPSSMIDHINGNRSDNRISNLRLASPADNSRNAKAGKNNTSGYKGVFFSKQAGKFQARITVNRLKRHLGYFDTAEAAHESYKTAAVKYHGEFHNVG